MAQLKNINHESFERHTKFKYSSNRSFGLTISIFFGLIAFLPILSGRPLRLWSTLPFVIFLVLALFIPASLSRLNYYWARFGLLLHYMVSPIVLGLIFFLIFTPIGRLLKIFNKDVLNLKIERKLNSYWINSSDSVSSMKDQF